MWKTSPKTIFWSFPKYPPIGFFNKETLASNLLKVMPHANFYHFGILQSLMHMAWVRAVGGRLEMRHRYSKDIVYNNFPWPEVEEENPEWKTVFVAASSLLNARKNCTGTLADLYDPLTMPK